MLSVSLRTLARALERGDLSAQRCGRRVLIPVAELHRFLGDSLSLSIGELRRREIELFQRDEGSKVALCLAVIRGEFQRLAAGLPVRLDVIERVLAGSPAIDSKVSLDRRVAQEVS